MAALLLAMATVVGVMISKAQTVSPVATSGIAVLPFESLSPDKESAFFAYAVYDGVLTKLEKLANLKVINHNSVAKYRGARDTQEIGRDLNVAYLLRGNVRKEAASIHVNAELIGARKRSRVGGAIRSKLERRVRASERDRAENRTQAGSRRFTRRAICASMAPTVDLISYDAYLRAKDLLYDIALSTRQKEDLFQAVELLDQAVARDPGFFDAYCQLAGAHDRIYFLAFDHTDARLKLAQTAIQSIQRLRPESGDTHLALAQHYYYATPGLWPSEAGAGARSSDVA